MATNLKGFTSLLLGISFLLSSTFAQLWHQNVVFVKSLAPALITPIKSDTILTSGQEYPHEKAIRLGFPLADWEDENRKTYSLVQFLVKEPMEGKFCSIELEQDAYPRGSWSYQSKPLTEDQGPGSINILRVTNTFHSSIKDFPEHDYPRIMNKIDLTRTGYPINHANPFTCGTQKDGLESFVLAPDGKFNMTILPKSSPPSGVVIKIWRYSPSDEDFLDLTNNRTTCCNENLTVS